MKYQLLYFASLRDAAGREVETVESVAVEPRALFVELVTRHGFDIEPARLRVAVNGELTSWDTRLVDGDEIVFLPPVSGG